MTSPVDDYIAGTSGASHDQLTQLRDLIRAAAPEASEKISYGMPTWYLNGNLVHIAAFARHVSLFPGGVVPQFAHLFPGHKLSKGTIQFPLDRPLPLDAIRTVVDVRVEQQRTKPAR